MSMSYTHKLTLSMAVPTAMVAGAGGCVVAGAFWLQAQAQRVDAAAMAGHLQLGAVLTAVLTLLCVAVCLGFTVWIRRTARQVLGGEPSEAQAALGQLADGNLGLALPAAPAGSLLGSVGRLHQALRTTVQQIHQASGSIATATSEIAQGNLDLSQRTEQAAAHLQGTAARMDALNRGLQETVEVARQAHVQAADAADLAARGGAVVQEVVQAMDGIHDSSRRIHDIIGVIDGIAFQTNILALNAAVEAARAGEQGRGFAVVAGEVRGLAGRSAEAAREIKALIEDSVARVQAGAAQAQQAGQLMHDIVAAVQRLRTAMEGISQTSRAQAAGLDDIHAAIGQLDQFTQHNAALVEQSAAAAASLREQVAGLEAAVRAFRE